MDISRDAAKAINTLVLHQVHQPPPLTVLHALSSALRGRVPSALVATASWKLQSRWDIVACTDEVVVVVHAAKQTEDWFAGSKDDGLNETVTAQVRRLRDIRSVTAENPKGTDEFSQDPHRIFALWRVDFGHGNGLALDAHANRTHAMDEVVCSIVDAFHGPQSESGT